MHGCIRVESKKDVGSVFTVDIPFKKVSHDIQKIETDEEMGKRFSDIRSLIIDDDKDSCEYTGILMERLGVAHDYVTSGEQALQMLGEAEDQGQPYNLCFIDWKMPDMDGRKVTEKIREIFEKIHRYYCLAYDSYE